MKQSRRFGHDAARPPAAEAPPQHIQGVVVPAEMPSANLNRPLSEILREQGILDEDPLAPPPPLQSTPAPAAAPTPSPSPRTAPVSGGASGVSTPPNALHIPIGSQQMLPMDQIDVSPHQPRLVFDQDALASLTSTIDLVGLNNPITVRRKEDGRFELIAGERRFRAFQLKHEAYIPGFVRDLGEKEAAILAMTDNDAREDLSDFERALGYQRLLKLGHCLNQMDISRCVGRSMATVSRCLAYFKLPQVVIDMLMQRPELIGTKVVADFVAFHEQGCTELVIAAVVKVEKGMSQENALNWLKAEARKLTNPAAVVIPRRLQMSGKPVADAKIDGRNLILKCPKDVNPELLLRTIEKFLSEAAADDLDEAA